MPAGRNGPYHGKGGRPGTVLGLNDLVPAELDAVGERFDVFIGKLGSLHLCLPPHTPSK